MELTRHQKRQDACDKIYNAFGMATAILQFAIRENVSGFVLSGLKVPEILQTWTEDAEMPPVEEFNMEVTIFQEHLADRIAALAHNRRMLEEIWRFNEETREFRERELAIPEAARDILDQTATLINALFAQDQDAALAVFDHCFSRRRELIEQIVPQMQEQDAMVS